ncbi:MAG TPA: UTP--glucose-1-phosphate uridylyltransferase [Candidatus Parcubacteria bacterium]|jgi:UTP--glucose-1-phosphate uridylyltransferase|nr:UTP--glucose-1-phosphate uridylyltransferase [Parcubacteria group bacterium]HJN61982.1 UTP--glucose-1-phosphate uridylyltransferase [Candidatus Parcubacteria bacterium]|tara:strand:- start:10762 stop:11649 length:888 start_codon:yes stop_codon:yes gene_type:complete
MITKIRKAIIPIAGLGTRFLPLSKAFPKELLPLADRPIIQYLLEEAIAAGIEEIIFVTRPAKKNHEIVDYFENAPKLEKILKSRDKEYLLDELKNLKELSEKLSFTYVIQKEPLGDGHAILQAKKLIGEEPCAVFFCDDLVDSKIPCLSQLLSVFKTCQKPILALKKLPKKELFQYGVVDTEKIASRLHKIKNIIEKPSIDTAPSDLAVLGRYIITPEVFDYLKKTPASQKGEIVLANTFKQMVKDGKMIYGYEVEGRWLDCGDKLRWLKTNLYFSLNHPKFGPELKKFLEEINQ